MNATIKEWVDKATGDYHTASRELQVSHEPNFDAVCFHAQQCIEKLMKARQTLTRRPLDRSSADAAHST